MLWPFCRRGQDPAKGVAPRSIGIHVFYIRRQVSPDVDLELEVHKHIHHRLIGVRFDLNSKAAVRTDAGDGSSVSGLVNLCVGQRQIDDTITKRARAKRQPPSRLAPGSTVHDLVDTGVRVSRYCALRDRKRRRCLEHARDRRNTTGASPRSRTPACRQRLPLCCEESATVESTSAAHRWPTETQDFLAAHVRPDRR